jgi:ABC-2 type transport system permease protein
MTERDDVSLKDRIAQARQKHAEASAASAVAHAPGGPASGKVTFFRVLGMEWLKLFSLRSSWWLLLVTVLLGAGLSILQCAMAKPMFAYTEEEMLERGMTGEMLEQIIGSLATTVANSCTTLAQLIFISLGVIVMTNEFASGMIRSTFTAVPHRWLPIVAKAVLLAVISGAITAAAVLVSWAIGFGMLDGEVFPMTGVAYDTSLGGDNTRVLVGAIFLIIGMTLFGFAVGLLVRSSSGGICVALGVVLVLPLVFTMLGANSESTGWKKGIYYLQSLMPGEAGMRILSTAPVENFLLTPWQGIGVLFAWDIVLIGIGIFLTAKRDL